MAVFRLPKHGAGKQKEASDTLHKSLGSPLTITAAFRWWLLLCWQGLRGKPVVWRPQQVIVTVCDGMDHKAVRSFKEISSSMDSWNYCSESLWSQRGKGHPVIQGGAAHHLVNSPHSPPLSLLHPQSFSSA